MISRISRLLISIVIIFFSFTGESQSIDDLESTVDSIIQIGLDSMAYPGCQVVMMHKGQVVLKKSYGYHTYEKKISVENDHIYDLASLTKVTSGLPLLMMLVDEKKIDLDYPISTYLPGWKNSNKAELTLRELLSHQAGMKPYIVYWAEAIEENGRIAPNTYAFSYSEEYPIKLSEDLYLHRNYEQVLKNRVKKSEVQKNPGYRYSGLIFLMIPELISRVSGKDYVTLLNQELYLPLGIHRMGYNPLERYGAEIIVPTERDEYFRHSLVKGRVHDEAAAMLEGVSCNAGLFSDAMDVATLFQFYLNKGRMEEEMLVKEETLTSFTSYQYEENRRGLGFDKPLLEYNKNNSYVSEHASSASYGHSGFTGTFAWADPSNQTVIVFLSNRVYPSRENRKLYSLNIRPQLHDVLYTFFPVID